MTTRRGFLASLMAASTLPRFTWADAGSPAYLGAARIADGTHRLIGLSESGAELFRIRIPDRGHAAAAHPEAPEAVAFARRPGTFALVIDCAAGSVAHRLSAPAGRHFYGHGVFVAGGDVLCTTENDIATGEGRIGLWSRSDGYRRMGEIATGGIGPHDVLRLDDDVLVVANGGIRTDPARGPDKLNLDTMRPSLTYLTPLGEVLDEVTLAPGLARNSIRHLARAADGTVAFAMQWQGEATDPVPLLGLHRRGSGAPRLLAAGLADQSAMQGDAGSVALSADGRAAAITSPRGGRLHRFDTRTGRCEVYRRADICGLARRASGFAATDATGAILALETALVPLAQHAGLAWDNHLVPISA